MSKLADTNAKIAGSVAGGFKKIEDGVTGGYKKIEDGVVGGYKKVETGAVSAFSKVSDKFVEKLFARGGETVEEACMVHGIDVDKLLALVNEEANKAQ